MSAGTVRSLLDTSIPLMVDLATFQISLEVRRSVIFDGLDRIGEDIGVVAKNEAIRSPTVLLLFF